MHYSHICGRLPGGIPEEGIVIIGDDSFLCVIAPEDLPVERMWRWKTVILMILTLHRSRLMCEFVSLFLFCLFLRQGLALWPRLECSARAQLTATSASQVQAILVSQPPE